MITNIILDLDETLISAIEKDTLKENKSMSTTFKEKYKHFKIHSMGKEYFITERPHVQEFLDFIFSNYNVSIWTAASKNYASFVIKKVIMIKPNRKLDFILFSKHCDISERKSGCIKRLDNLFHIHRFNKENTIIIDDNKNVFEKQDNHVIRIKAFNILDVDSENDIALKEIEKYLINHKQ